MRVGMALRSQTLVANAWHHRTDSLSSLVAAIGIGGSWAGVPALDPIAAIVVAGEARLRLHSDLQQLLHRWCAMARCLRPVCEHLQA